MTPERFKAEGLKVVRCTGHVACADYHHTHAELACGMEYCPDSGRLIVSTKTAYGQRVGDLTGNQAKETAAVLVAVFVEFYPTWTIKEVVLVS